MKSNYYAITKDKCGKNVLIDGIGDSYHEAVEIAMNISEKEGLIFESVHYFKRTVTKKNQTNHKEEEIKDKPEEIKLKIKKIRKDAYNYPFEHKNELIAGVYKIENINNGRCYIGKASNIYGRWKVHFKKLISGKHENALLQNDWVEFGSGSYKFSVVEIVENKKLLYLKEVYWVNKTKEVYNIARPQNLEKLFNKLEQLGLST